MLLQLSRSAKSPYVKLRALELVMLYDGYDLSVLSTSPSVKRSMKNTGSLAHMTIGEPVCNQQDNFLQGQPNSSGSESLENSIIQSEIVAAAEHLRPF